MIGRRSAVVSSSALPGSISTRSAATSGTQRATGSSSANRPSSASVIAAATVTGLLIEAIRKIVSRCIGSPAAISR